MYGLVISIVLLGAMSLAYADEPVTLWVPQSMIAGDVYHGVVIIGDATAQGSLALLSTADDTIVRVPHSVSVLPHQNHGIFSIKPASAGQTEIFAAVDGDLLAVPVQVFSSKDTPDSLRIIPAANKTRADSMTGYVTISDRDGLPAMTHDDVIVTLSTLGAIDAPSSIIIENQTTSARFEMDIRGNGTVIASAESFATSSADIQKIQSRFAVKMAVAPDIAMQDSVVFYYVWMEKDGRPFRPPYVIDGFIHTGNSDVARFDANPYTVWSAGSPIHLIDGVARGIIYTGNSGDTKITTSVAGFGSAHDALFVGPVQVQDMIPYVSEESEADVTYEPNTVLAWIYPPVTDGDAWMVAATYHANSTDTLAKYKTLVPTRADGSILYVSSGPGLIHDTAHVLEEHITKTNAIEFEISGHDHGSYDVVISGQDLESGSSMVNIVPSHVEGFDLGIVLIPAVPFIRQDIAMVSILDDAGAMIDIRDTFDEDVRFLVSAGSAALASDVVSIGNSNTAIVQGVLSGPDSVMVVLDGVGATSADVLPAGSSVSLELLIPGHIHVKEEFPFAVHEVNSAGAPIRGTGDLRISSPLDVSVSQNGHMILDNAGASGIIVVSEIGAAGKEIVGFENIIHATLDLEKTSFRTGENITLGIKGSIDANHTLRTDLPFERVDSKTWVIIPDTKGVFTLDVLVTRDGYGTVILSEDITVEEILAVEVAAVDSAGYHLSIPVTISIGAQSVDAVLPYQTEFEPDTIDVTFPEKITVSGRGYLFEKITLDGDEMYDSRLSISPKQDVHIQAAYNEEVLINVIDGEGSGIYRHGDIVRISASDRHKMTFLIRDVFDHWEGSGINHTDSEQEFVAEADADITAVYREDYTYLMAIIGIPVMSAGVWTLVKKAPSLRWMIQNVLEKISIPSIRSGDKKNLYSNNDV